MKFGSNFYPPLCHDIKGLTGAQIKVMINPLVRQEINSREKWQFFLPAAWIIEIADIRKISLW